MEGPEYMIGHISLGILLKTDMSTTQLKNTCVIFCVIYA
jgi:hypothetical protein